MKEEHKELIEHIISEFKKSENGIIHRYDLQAIFSNNDDDVISSVWNLIIKNLKLVESVAGENYNYTLTKAGYDFISFKDNEAKELALKKKEQAEIENTLSNTEVNKWLIKTKWYPLVISIGAVFVSIYFGINDISKTNELEERILNLEKKSESSKNDTKPLNINPNEAVEKGVTKKNDTLKKT
jgi:hypothetical protein